MFWWPFVVSFVFGENLKGEKTEIKINDKPRTQNSGYQYTTTTTTEPEFGHVDAGADIVSPAMVQAAGPLHGECFESEQILQGTDAYTYEVCAFRTVTQKKGGWSWTLGHFQSWGICVGDIPCWKFGNGQECASGKQRDTEVLLVCGEDGVHDLDEFETCSYRLTLALKAFCDLDSVMAESVVVESVLESAASIMDEIEVSENKSEFSDDDGHQFQSSVDRDFYLLKRCMNQLIKGISLSGSSFCKTFADSYVLNIANPEMGNEIEEEYELGETEDEGEEEVELENEEEIELESTEDDESEMIDAEEEEEILEGNVPESVGDEDDSIAVEGAEIDDQIDLDESRVQSDEEQDLYEMEEEDVDFEAEKINEGNGGDSSPRIKEL